MSEREYRQDSGEGAASGKGPLVSICIPARNSEATIGYVIENLLNQRYSQERFEIIVADHASTDNTGEVVRRYLSKHDIKLIYIGDGTQGRAYVRNRCLEAARGEIVIFIDSDILVCDTFIEEHLRARESQANGLVAGYVFGKMQVFGADDGGDRRLLSSSIGDRYKTLLSSPMYKDAREFYGCINKDGADCQLVTSRPDAWRVCWSCNLSARRQDLLDIGGFDESFRGWGLEDEELGYRFLQGGKDLIFAKKAWGYHVPHRADSRRNYAEFKRNLSRFFNAHQTADIELLHINFFPSTLRTVLGTSSNFQPNDAEYGMLVKQASAKLDQPAGSRLGLFLRRETDAPELGLTHCFMPGLSWNTPPYQKELAGQSCRFYSLLGLHTGFASGEITEAVLFVDILMFINESLLSMILLEVGRISRTVLLIHGAISNNPDNAETRRCFEKLLSMVKVDEIITLNV